MFHCVYGIFFKVGNSYLLEQTASCMGASAKKKTTAIVAAMHSNSSREVVSRLAIHASTLTLTLESFSRIFTHYVASRLKAL
jgi:hypothetical protein